VGVAIRETAPDDLHPRIVSDVLAPVDLDPLTLAFASVCVLESHGSFTVVLDRYEVRIGARRFEVTVDWDHETESRFGTAIDLVT
jgi:hypothetical protein